MKIEKTLKKGIENISKLVDLEPKNCQIEIRPVIVDGEIKDLTYYARQDYVNELRQISFNDVLGVKFDLMQREALSKDFMTHSINNIAEDENLKLENMKIFVFTNTNEIEKIRIVIFNMWDRVKILTVEELFK